MSRPMPSTLARALRLARSGPFADGAREVTPGALGIAIWGVITGITMVQAGLTVPQALGMTLIVYSGTAQLATLGMIVAGAPYWLVMATAVLVSLRFFVYSAVVAVDFGHLPLRRRLLLGYLTIDAGLALYQSRREALGDTATRYRFFMGSNVLVWASWQLASVAGVLAAGLLPRSAGSFAYLGTLAVAALLVPMLRTRPSLAGAVVAGVVATALMALPFKLGLFAGVIAGAAAAVAVAARSPAGGVASAGTDMGARRR